MPKTQTEIESKQQPIRQEEERNYSVTDNLIESNGMGLFTPLDTLHEDEQVPSWQKKKKDKKKKESRNKILINPKFNKFKFKQP